MYIKRIVLKNIRGFAHLDFDLTRPGDRYAGWTVFTGDNGSGKTALLKAIAVGLMGRDTARSVQPSFLGWMRSGAEDAGSSIYLEVVRNEADDALVESGKSPGAAFPAMLAISNGGKEPSLHAVVPPRKPKNYSTPDRTIWASDAGGWFSCGYGPFRRMFGESPAAARQMAAPLTARFVTMFQEAASLIEADSWLRSLKHKELENKQSEREQLALILEILRDDLMPNQITVDRVDSDGLWLKDRNGVQLSWADMSDGYRSAAAVLADIIRHLIGTYGFAGLSEKNADGKTIIQRSGVVLIDEIDAHLHPAWQREIGFWLVRHFPNIQFLVTSHSPLICQAAGEKGLFVLPQPASEEVPHQLDDEEYRKIIASRPDTILLTSAFGLQNTRSPVAVEKRARLAKLEAKKRAGGALTQLELFDYEKNKFYLTPDEEA